MRNSGVSLDSTSECTQESSTADETVHMPDEFQDLVELAKEADQVIGNSRAWPLPFTITKAGTNHSSTQEVDGRIHFVFTYPRLAEALRKEDDTLQVPTPDNLKQRVTNWGSRGEPAPISTESGDKTWLIKRWSREAYLHQKLKEQCFPEDVVRELKGVSGYTTTSMICYRYGDVEDTEELKGFAAGDRGFERMCAETLVTPEAVILQLWKDGMQGSFWGTSGDGRPTEWFIRRLGWT